MGMITSLAATRVGVHTISVAPVSAHPCPRCGVVREVRRKTSLCRSCRSCLTPAELKAWVS